VLRLSAYCVCIFQGVSGRGSSAQDLLIQNLLHDYHSSVDPSGFIDLRFGLWIMCARFDKDKAKLTTDAVESYVSANDTSPIPSVSSRMQPLHSGDIMTDRHTDRRRQIYRVRKTHTQGHKDRHTDIGKERHRHTYRCTDICTETSDGHTTLSTHTDRHGQTDSLTN